MALEPVSIAAEIGKWSGQYEEAQTELSIEQDNLLIANNEEDAKDPGKKNVKRLTSIRQKVARLQIKLGLAKEFLDFWKDRMKDFIQLLKMIAEIASPR